MRKERHMSSQSHPGSNRPGRRFAAALGASAALSMTLVGPAFSSQPHDPTPSTASAQCGTYEGGGKVAICSSSSGLRDSGAGSSSAADRGLPAPASRVTPKLVVNSEEPTNVPVMGLGVAAAVVVAGGLMITSMNRRRPA